MKTFYYFVLLYGLYWSFFILGFIVVKTKYGKKLESFTWNSRIDAFQKPPFVFILKFINEKKYLPFAFLVAAINLNMVLFQFLLGVVFLAPLLSLASGFMAGGLFGQAEKRTVFPYGTLTLVFEFGAFATAGALGMTWGSEWLLGDRAFFEALQYGLETTSITVYFIPFILLLLNGFVEAAGPVYYDIKGVPDAEAIKNKEYKDSNGSLKKKQD